MSKGIVLSLCDKTGNAVRDWAKSGYECVCVDIQHSIRRTKVDGNIEFLWADIRSWWPDNMGDVIFVSAFPPCTHLCVSGCQDWPKKGLQYLIDSLELVEACRRIAEASNAPFYIENPVGRLSTIWRKPDYMFNPCDYAGYLKDSSQEAYTKKTCLWTGGGFRMPKPKPVKPVDGSKTYMIGPSEDRADLRSVTPRGFSRAVYLANRPKTIR